MFDIVKMHRNFSAGNNEFCFCTIRLGIIVFLSFSALYGGTNSNDIKIPMKVMDQHHDSHKFIKEAIEQQKLPQSGNTLIHLDAHIDELVPDDMQIRVALNSKCERNILFGDFGIENWIKNAVNDGYLKHVIWVKPPWAVQTEDSHRDLENGVTLDIKTLGRSVFENTEEDFESFKNTFSKYLSPGDPYILDMELNFFSSDSPFADQHTKVENYYDKLKDIFECEIPESRDAEAIEQAAEDRAKKLEELSAIFHNLQDLRKMPPVDGEPSEDYIKISNIRDEILQHYEEAEVDWKQIYDYGAISTNFLLPVHYTKYDDIVKLIDDCLGKMLDTIPTPPSLILIAIMYDYDRYTPRDYWPLLNYLVDFFKKRHNLDIFWVDY